MSNLPSCKRSSLGVLLASAVLSVCTSTASASASQNEVHYHHAPQDVVADNEKPQAECGDSDDSCYWDDAEEIEDEEDYENNESSEKGASHKQQQNHTYKDRGDSGLKQATKDTDSGSAEDEQLLKWLSDKAVPEATACGVYLAPSTIPGAGLGLFAGRAFDTNDIVTEGDIVIPLSELDWHNGFQLDFFLWEEYTWSASSFVGMEEENGYVVQQTVTICILKSKILL